MSRSGHARPRTYCTTCLRRQPGSTLLSPSCLWMSVTSSWRQTPFQHMHFTPASTTSTPRQCSCWHGGAPLPSRQGLCVHCEESCVGRLPVRSLQGVQGPRVQNTVSEINKWACWMTYYSLKYPFAFKALHSLKYSGTHIKEDLRH